MDEFLELMEQARAMVDFHREQLILRKFSPDVADQMAVELHAFLITNIGEQVMDPFHNPAEPEAAPVFTMHDGNPNEEGVV